MPTLGKTTALKIVKELDFGVYLDGGEWGEILLPARYVPENARVGDDITVFIYLDSEDTIIATTETPYVELGQCAFLKVVDVNDFGTFLDWGLTKDLFVPFKEQRVVMQVGRSYAVYVFEDNTGRLCASSKLDHFLNEKSGGQFTVGQEVKLLIATQSPIGHKAVINGTHLGLIHNNDILPPLRNGQKITGYIKNIRSDDSIDLVLQRQGAVMKETLTAQIMIDLQQGGGISHITDKSPATTIFQHYQVSKSNYKKALGQLYKERKIILAKDKITLAPPATDS